MSRRSASPRVDLVGLAVAAFVLWQPAVVGKAIASLSVAFALTAGRLLEPLFVFPH